MIELTTKDGKIEVDPNNIVEYKELPYGLKYIKYKVEAEDRVHMYECIIYESMKEIMTKVRIEKLEDLLKKFERQG